MTETTGTVRLDTADIFYRELGEGGVPLLLLHGNGEDSGCFDRQLAALAARRRVLAPDSRGHGRSGRGSAPLTIRQMALDMAAFLDALGVGRAAVVGFSDGGNVAIQLALDRPALVERLVLAGANLYPAGVRPSAQAPITAGYGLCRLCGLFSARARAKAEILGLMVREPHYTPERLGRIACPALVLAGDRDLIKREHTGLIARSIPGARLEVIPDSDHFLFQRQPERVNALLAEFLFGEGEPA